MNIHGLKLQLKDRAYIMGTLNRDDPDDMVKINKIKRKMRSIREEINALRSLKPKNKK